MSSARETLIRNKSVLLSQPYVPKHQSFSPFVGNDNILQMIVAAWSSSKYSPPLNPLLIGVPGVGKTAMVIELAKRLGKQLFIFQGHEEVSPEDFAAGVRFSDDENKRMDYFLSPLTSAMVTGSWCLIDEIGKIRPRALSLLSSLGDERSYLDSILLGDRIEAEPGFRWIANANSDELGNIPEFLRSRLSPVIEVLPHSRSQIDIIVKNHFQNLNIEIKKLITLFWILWYDRNADQMPSVRDVISCFALSHKLSSADMNSLSLEMSSINGISEDDLRLAFETTFAIKNNI